MERGGPKGALVLFSLYAPDGLLAETLTKDGSVLSQSTTEPILAKITAWNSLNRICLARWHFQGTAARLTLYLSCGVIYCDCFESSFAHFC